MNKKTDWAAPCIRIPGRDGLTNPMINAHDSKVTSARAENANREEASNSETSFREQPLPNFVSPKPHRAGLADNDNFPSQF